VVNPEPVQLHGFAEQTTDVTLLAPAKVTEYELPLAELTETDCGRSMLSGPSWDHLAVSVAF
jgi:hypothetical protein